MVPRFRSKSSFLTSLTFNHIPVLFCRRSTCSGHPTEHCNRNRTRKHYTALLPSTYYWGSPLSKMPSKRSHPDGSPPSSPTSARAARVELLSSTPAVDQIKGDGQNGPRAVQTVREKLSTRSEGRAGVGVEQAIATPPVKIVGDGSLMIIDKGSETPATTALAEIFSDPPSANDSDESAPGTHSPSVSKLVSTAPVVEVRCVVFPCLVTPSEADFSRCDIDISNVPRLIQRMSHP